VWTYLLIAAVGVAHPTTEVRTLAGETLTGAILKLDEQGIIVDTADGEKSVDLERLAGLAPKQLQAQSNGQPAVWVSLADKSLLVGADYVAREGRARIASTGGDVFELPTQDVVAVRLQPDNEAIAAQWERILDRAADSDLLVVRKDEVLDFHRGMVRNVSESTIEFQTGADILNVKRTKVFGIVYYHPVGRVLPNPICRLTDASGSIWVLRSLSLDEGTLKGTTLLGVEVNRPLISVVRVDFSQGKIVYLSDLEPESVHWLPYLGAARPLATRSEWYSPRKDTNLNGSPLELSGKVYPKGLALHSRTELVYRLPAGFQRFKTLVGIDDAVRPRGHVRLVIRADDRVLEELTVTGVDKAIPLDLDISGAGRLAILVDFGDDLDVADHLDLCEARIVK
jgi:hypothetical protein